MARWPRKNDAESIRARQEALGLNGPVTGIDLEPFAFQRFAAHTSGGERYVV